jgi:predicted permease
MSWRVPVARLLGSIWGTHRRDRDLRDELNSHIEIETDANIQRGLDATEARRAALLKLGNPQLVYESSHAMWSVPTIGSILADLRFSWRILWKNPAFAIVAVVTLALGIGSSSAVFTIANAVLLRRMPYPDSSRIVLLWGSDGGAADRGQVSFTDTEDIRRSNRSFSAICNYADWTPTLSGQGEPERLAATQVSDGFFDVIGVKPAIGRPFLAAEHIDGHDNVVILSHELWTSKFNADPGIIGRAIQLNSMPHVVVGIMPKGFEPLPSTLVQGGALYRPVGETYDDTQRRSEHLRGIARLRPGATLKQAQADVDGIARELEREHPKEDAGVRYRIASLQEDSSTELKPSLSILSLAVVLLLLSACANLAGLLLARGSTRQREFAMRLSLGAPKRRIFRQVLIESLILGSLGGLFGMALVFAARRAGIALAPKLGSQLSHVTVDGRVLAFCGLAVLFTSILFGLAPAFRAAHVSLSEALKQSAQSVEGPRSGQYFRSAIVVGEFVLALTLLTVSTQLIQTFVRLRQIDMGFDPAGRVVMNVWLPSAKYKDPGRSVAFFEELLRRVSSLPGVTSSALVQNPPLGSFDGRAVLPQGKADIPQNLLSPQAYLVTPDYFRTMGISLLRGRIFTNADNEHGQAVAIVSQNLANRMFPGQDAIGRKLQLYSDKKIDGRYPDRTIVGVVSNVRHLGPDGRVTEGLYVPFRQLPVTFMSLVLWCKTPVGIVPSVRRELRSLDSDVAAFRIGNYVEFLADSLLIRKMATVLIASFGAVALFLAGVGLYGLLSYTVSLRIREFGVRAALGALPRDLVALVVQSCMKLLIIGATIGLISSALAARIVATTLAGTVRLDWATIVSCLAMLTAVGFVACTLPARTAGLANPAATLRGE